MRVDDLIVLGRTVPEESKRYGQRVCMAGYSEELRQLMRVYPLEIQSPIKARYLIGAELERNNMDSRLESWALKDRSSKSILSIGPVISKEVLRPMLESQVVESVDELNINRRSLGVLKPESFEIVCKNRTSIEHPQQLQLFDNFKDAFCAKVATDFFTIPYVKIHSEKKQQCFQLREWGIYELMRKYQEQGRQTGAGEIKKALHVQDESDVYFVVGNMNNARNIWLVIKVFVFKSKQRQQLLFGNA
jgi:hypothetical protein